MSNVKAAAKSTAKTINKIDKISRGRVMIAAAEAGGDTALSCSLPDGSLAFILSDGMGKGTKAADESRMVTFRLKELLKNGTAPSRAIKTVNRYMLELNGGREDFATVDLTVIDKQTGVAKFYKMGAATSFIIRSGKIKRIQQPALPVGIIPSLSATCISVRLKAG
ncbi:MAG: SpoIIE family protein phosphatase, partial [Ruminococcus sp.]